MENSDFILLTSYFLLVPCPTRSADVLVAGDLAVENFDDARDAPREFFVVCDHQHGFALTDDIGEHVENVVRRARVKIAGRLICNEQRRIVRERARNCRALLLPA